MLDRCSACSKPCTSGTCAWRYEIDKEIVALYPEIKTNEFMVCWPCWLRALGIRLKGDQEKPSVTFFGPNPLTAPISVTMPVFNPNVQYSRPCQMCGRHVMPPRTLCTFCSGETTG